MKRKLMDNFIIASIVLMGFYLGIYYSTAKFENQVQVWDSNYQTITDKVYAFEKVSDPETIRHYVKELNKMLLDLEFLNNIIESGQIADNTLALIIDKHQKKIDNVNNRILELNTQHNELVFKFKEQVTRLTVETDDNLELIESLNVKLTEQAGYIRRMNAQLERDIDSLEITLDAAGKTFFGKYIFVK